MNKRLLKRHKRQVARAHERVKLSEPSRPAGGWRGGSSAGYSGPSVRNSAGPATGSQAKGDG